jgi:hypothetical protein
MPQREELTVRADIAPDGIWCWETRHARGSQSERPITEHLLTGDARHSTPASSRFQEPPAAPPSGN